MHFFSGFLHDRRPNLRGFKTEPLPAKWASDLVGLVMLDHGSNAEQALSDYRKLVFEILCAVGRRQGMSTKKIQAAF